MRQSTQMLNEAHQIHLLHFLKRFYVKKGPICVSKLEHIRPVTKAHLREKWLVGYRRENEVPGIGSNPSPWPSGVLGITSSSDPHGEGWQSKVGFSSSGPGLIIPRRNSIHKVFLNLNFLKTIFYFWLLEWSSLLTMM